MTKSYWFEHDYNAANDAKILFLRQQLGMEGYGIYWFIVEQLVQAGGKLPLKVVPVLAMQPQTQESKVNAIISGYDLFSVEEDFFFSLRLNKHIETRKYYSEMGKKGVEIREGRRGASSGASSGVSREVLSKTDRQTNKQTLGGYFLLAENTVVFNDESRRELTTNELEQIHNGKLKPWHITK
jgi:hypothetical protein